MWAKIAAVDFKKSAMAAPVKIEIAPVFFCGEIARSQGTWQAVENECFMQAICFCCQTDLLCIVDTNFVLCANCKVVRPMEGCSLQGSKEGG